MKKKVVIAIIASAMLMSSASAEVKLSENTDTRVLTVSGSIDGTNKTNLISLNVNNEEGSEVYSATIPTADGSLNDYSFKLPDVSGKYKISLTGYEGDPVLLDYEYISSADIAAILNSINEEDDTSKIVELMNEKSAALDLDNSWYESLTGENKQKIADVIKNERPEGGYTSLEEIKSIAREKLALISIDDAKDSEAVQAAYAEFADIYKLEENTKLYNEYKDMSDDVKGFADNIVAAGNINAKSDLYKLFDEAVFLAMINLPKQPADITDTIDKYGEEVSFSNDKYAKSDKDLTAAYLYAKKGNLKTLEVLSSEIDNAYDAQNKKTGTGGSSGSSGGSSKNNKGSGIVSTITNPTPEQKTEEEEVFEDMENAEWAKPAVLYLNEKNIVSGVEEKKFKPQGLVTREQFAVMLVRAFNLSDGTAVSSFEDLPESHWAYGAVSAAYQNKVVSGISAVQFGTGENIRRCDMAVMAVKAAQIAGYELSKIQDVSFTDFEEIPEYARESAEIMAAAGIINGYEDGSFKPFNNATRAEAAQIIYTIIK